ncbi:unnamed protein product [Moneuplotes crassus]|uniref:Uncharacterized protein n=1 Tax=Euplotes crassus TaxID=5936 RepID=A0AAD1XL18_EUPCR|nr:unnamed protein product [Moneuplotes crassus]
MKKSANFALDSVRGLDMYPKTIKLTYKGNEEFKTLLGGVVSLGIKVVILIYTWTMFSIMLSNKNSSKSINTSVKNLRQDNDIVELQNSTFQFAVSGIFNGSEIDIMAYPEAFVPEVRIITKLANETSYRNETVPLVQCGDNFKYDNQTEVKYLGINEYYCPQSRDFKMQGNVLSDAYQYFEVNINRCDNATSSVTCFSSILINQQIEELEIGVYVVNSYFDFDDYNSPIKTYIDDRFFYYVVPDRTLTSNVYVQKNEIETQDNYFAYKPGGKKSDIYEIRRIDNRLSVEDTASNNLLNLKFIKDPFTQSYDRGVITILDVIGNIGGLMGIFVVGGGFIVNLFSDKLFLYSIFSNMYKVQKPSNSSAINATLLKINHFGNEEFGNKEYASSEDHSESYSKNGLAEKAKQAMLRRAKYDWKLTDLIYNTLSVFSVVFRCCLNKKNPMNIHQRLKLFEIAEQKYVRELDAVEFSKNMRNLNTLVASLLDKKEQLLVQHQKSNVLILDESVESEEKSITDVPKLFSKSPLIDNYAKRTDKLMEKLKQETWDPKRYRLIRGVYSSRLMESRASSPLGEDHLTLFEKRSHNTSTRNEIKEIEEMKGTNSYCAEYTCKTFCENSGSQDVISCICRFLIQFFLLSREVGKDVCKRAFEIYKTNF